MNGKGGWGTLNFRSVGGWGGVFIKCIRQPSCFFFQSGPKSNELNPAQPQFLLKKELCPQRNLVQGSKFEPLNLGVWFFFYSNHWRKVKISGDKKGLKERAERRSGRMSGFYFDR